MVIVYVILPLLALAILGWGMLVGWAIGVVSKLEQWDFQDDCFKP